MDRKKIFHNLEKKKQNVYKKSWNTKNNLETGNVGANILGDLA